MTSTTLTRAAQLDEILSAAGVPDSAEWHQGLYTASAAVDHANGVLYVATSFDVTSAEWKVIRRLITTIVGRAWDVIGEVGGMVENFAGKAWVYRIPIAA
jgi:hypothetical protein